MTEKFQNRSRLSFRKYDEIEDYINQGKLDSYDIVYTTDTHENVVIDPELNIIPIRSKIYRFPDIATANDYLNTASDSYEGQVVAILANGKYTGYIINKNKDNEFYVSPLSDPGKIDYDTLGNRPIINKVGTLDNPITIENLDDGIYKIRGQYKLSINAVTVYLSTLDNIFLVRKDSDHTYIKKISATDITDYTVNSDGSTSASTIPTSKMLKDYATKTYVEERLAALDFITKGEVESFVTQTVTEILNSQLDTLVEEKVKNIYAPSEKSDIDILFN